MKKPDKPAHKLINPVFKFSSLQAANAIPSQSKSIHKMSVNFAELMVNDPSFRDSINQISADWNSLDTIKSGRSSPVFVHPALKEIDWRIYDTCYGNFYDDDDVKPANNYKNYKNYKNHRQNTPFAK